MSERDDAIKSALKAISEAMGKQYMSRAEVEIDINEIQSHENLIPYLNILITVRPANYKKAKDRSKGALPVQVRVHTLHKNADQRRKKGE